ncbi:MAG: branched-chain amino acid ABC transporter permease [Deltaproteobacteria bacterium]|nr:branched-chain amino acid ABC transporter permease [Deltaproteobacteria bacterium]
MSPLVALYITQGLNGLGYGMLLFLVSSGLTLIYGMMGFLNLSHAFFFMLGAYFCATFLGITGSFWISLLLAPLAVALVGMLAERFFLRNLEHNELGYIGQVLPTLGIALIILTSISLLWSRSLWIETPRLLQGVVSIGGLSYPIYRIFIIGLSLVVLIFLAMIIYLTRLGLILRGAVSDSDMVNALGVNIPLIFTLVFGISTWLAGVAGVALTPIFFVNAGFAYQWALETFVVVIVGGLGSLPGAFVVALLFGELHSYGVQFMPKLAPILMFLIMVLVLSFKPTGLFGKRG